MREDFGLCTYVRHHKQKILFFLSAMRSYANELRDAGFEVHYETLGSDSLNYTEALNRFVEDNQIQRIYHFEIEDSFFEQELGQSLKKTDLVREVWESPMFLTPREIFKGYLRKSPKPFMKTFYEFQRKRLRILIDSDGQPTGGKWSFDTENRKPLPSKLIPPAPRALGAPPAPELINLIQEKFQTHPGDLESFLLPTDRVGAKKCLADFLENRFSQFGDFEDALAPDSDFVFHSTLTPFLNVGLLLPGEVIEQALLCAKKKKIPLNSLEGFVRQVIGWREFIRGIYQNFNTEQESRNYFGAQKKLSEHWYRGDTGIEPLDRVIRKTLRLGYAHHIERLMVIGSLMLLLEIHPKEAHRWFMEMFIDSSDWVMGPNVYGMALFSDGGIFATKPYFCGSNYYRKMGGYKTADWSDGVDGLYWSFIDKHRNFFSKNPRLSMSVKTVDRMPEEKKKRIFEAADRLRDRLTREELR